MGQVSTGAHICRLHDLLSAEPAVFACFSYFEDGDLLPAGHEPSTTRIFGFILLCKLADLAARVVKDLYPAGRDRSQDWRLTGVRTMLESAIDGWLWELSLIEHEVSRTFGEDDDAVDEGEARAEAVEAVVRNLVLDVRLLICASLSSDPTSPIRRLR